VERGLEAVAALPRILPVGDRRTGHGGKAGIALRVDEVLARGGGALGALGVGPVLGAAARLDDLARAPARRQIGGGRRGAGALSIGAERALAIGSELLRVAVAGIHLDQPLLLRIVLFGRELLVPARAERRVEAPRGAMRDHDRRDVPLVQLREQLL